MFEQSAAAGPAHDTAFLTANYQFVYAVEPVSGASAAQTRVVVHRTIEMEVVNPAQYKVNVGKAWLYNYEATFPGAECYVYDGYVEPAFDDMNGSINATGIVDPYATGNLLTASAQPSPTGTVGGCQHMSSGV